MGRLTGKNILITGGNSGIGLAAAQEFDREGARVAICGLNEGTLQATKETLGAGSLALRVDVSNLTDLDTMFATIKREFGHLDGVLVNAGYSVFLPFEEVTEQSFDKVISIDFKGVYFTIQKALPLLRQGSSVIITSSVGARKGWPTTSIVSSCKAAVVHLARILSAELVGRGIRVNTLSPGPMDTAMFGRFAGEEQGNAVKEVLGTNNPSKRIADPKEIAKLAVYLASDDSAYVVGADFLIDGGVTAISAVGASPSLQRVEAVPVLPGGFRSVLERYQELAGPFEATEVLCFVPVHYESRYHKSRAAAGVPALSTPLLENASNQKTKEKRNENLTNVPTCFVRNSHHQFRAPGAQVSASRPDATSPLRPSLVYARHRCHRLCECRRGSRRSSRSRAWRYLC